MKKLLKIALIPMSFMVLSTTTSCDLPKKEIALITDVGDIDDGSFNQESWEAVKTYSSENNKTYDYYRPFNDSDFARECAVKQAVAKGAKMIILPGFKFSKTASTMTKKFPNVHFMLIDSSVDNPEDVPNLCCVGFKCEISGYLAGYTIAQDLLMRDMATNNQINNNYGYGYVGGMANFGVYQFGYGYIQGICQGTSEYCEQKNIELPNIQIRYNYAGVFAQDDRTAAKVKEWYNSGTKVVFPCGGKLYQSVTEASQYYNKHNLKNFKAWSNSNDNYEDPREAARWVGVDSNQYEGVKYKVDKKSIYTSALKGLKPSIMHALDFHYGVTTEEGTQLSWSSIGGHDQWSLGLNSEFGDEEGSIIKDDFVGIPNNKRDGSEVMKGFSKYTSNDYENVLKELENQPEKVYAGDGTEYTYIEGGSTKKPQSGYPNGMVDWEREVKKNKTEKFADTYLGKYCDDNKNKISIIVE